MELIALGTGRGSPSADRFCTANLIACGGSYYLFDAGAPVADLMLRYGIPIEKLKAAFLSHRHCDHVIGMVHLLILCDWRFKEADLDAYYPEESTLAALRQFIECSDGPIDETRMRLHTYGPGVVYEDENIKVTAVSTDHMNGEHPSYAFVIEGDGKRLIIAGDLHHHEPVDFPAIAETEPSDAVICELAHFQMEALMPHLRRCQCKRFLFNHYKEPWGIEQIQNLIADNPLDYPVYMLRDGDRIIL